MSGPLSVEWDTTGSTKCLNPVRTTHEGRPSKEGEKYVVAGKHKANPLYVDMYTPCHKCENCLRHRQRLWTARALAETRSVSRTWYGTLTLKPEAHFSALTRARARCTAQGEDFETFPPETRFVRVHAEIAKELTKFLKRVRAQSGPLRFLLVAEKHKSGDPHYHVLIHEQDAALPIRKALLEAQWSEHGFSHWRLVSDARPAHYVCKYLAKSIEARVRASIDYGSPPIVVDVSHNIVSSRPPETRTPAATGTALKGE